MFQINLPFLIESIFKIGLSVLCGIALGLERKSHNHVLGMRTLILICVSTTLMTLVSYYMACGACYGGLVDGDSTRIAAGVVSGIGFLGGGAILRQGLNIKGLTSAAIIWTTSALGLAIGVGLYIQSVLVLLLALLILWGLEKFESKFFPANSSKTMHLCFEAENLNLDSVKKIIEKNGVIISDINMSRVISTKQVILRYSVKVSKENDFTELIEELKTVGNLCEFSITD